MRTVLNVQALGNNRDHTSKPLEIRSFGGILLALFLIAGSAGNAAAVTFQWVSVGNPGNKGDAQATGTHGEVGSSFRIAAFEVTNGQYTQFLNSTAAADPYGLYNNPLMGQSAVLGGITRTGTEGAFHYETSAGRESMPVNWVSIYDAFRFANWVHNGQNAGGTETGAYSLNGENPTGVTREIGATIFLPSENEWYKAAYYDSISELYLDFPSGTDTHIECHAPSSPENRANCNSAYGGLTDVGSYPGSASPYGTFDQGGNVRELTDTLAAGGSSYITRGGDLSATPAILGAAERGSTSASSETLLRGFRLAALPASTPPDQSVPEPRAGLLACLGLLGLAYAGSKPCSCYSSTNSQSPGPKL